MNKADIIDLYNDFIDCSKQPNQSKCTRFIKPPKGRYDRYEKIKAEVEVMRTSLSNGNFIDPVADEDFLRELIFEDQNGIATVGPDGRIGGRGVEEVERENRFTNLITCKIFRGSLEELIKNPCAVTGEKLLKNMHNACEINQFVLVNRMIAASTQEVSALVSHKQLSQVFKLLVDNGIIARRNYGKGNNTVTKWYDKNVYMIEQLRILIKNGIGSDPDPIALSKLPVAIYEEY